MDSWVTRDINGGSMSMSWLPVPNCNITCSYPEYCLPVCSFLLEFQKDVVVIGTLTR